MGKYMNGLVTILLMSVLWNINFMGRRSPPLASKESGHAFVSRRPCWPACAVRLYFTNISKRCIRKYSTEINRDENSYELVFCSCVSQRTILLITSHRTFNGADARMRTEKLKKKHYTDYGLSRAKRTQRATWKQVSYSKIMANRMGI